MALDRRKATRLGSDRRQADRIPDYRMVDWRKLGHHQEHQGTLVQWSRQGVAILAEAEDTPRCGEHLLPRPRPDATHWKRPLRVMRVVKLEGGMRMIIALFCNESDLPRVRLSGGNGTPDRRHHNGKPKVERRRSPRWSTDKILNWRVHRGRKTRSSRLILRSLDGFVMVANPSEQPKEGARMRPATDRDRQRFGFHSARVKRVEYPHPDACLVFAEIEA